MRLGHISDCGLFGCGFWLMGIAIHFGGSQVLQDFDQLGLQGIRELLWVCLVCWWLGCRGGGSPGFGY